MSDSQRILAITACPTGIAHTFMAAENLEQAAARLGHEIKVETHGSIGVENALTAEDIDRADAVVVAADKQVDLSRFAGKRVVTAPVADGIRRPEELIREALAATPRADAPRQETREDAGTGFGATVYKALMNGVSHMIPFVVAGGLLLAVSLSLGGTPTPEGLVIPEDSFWYVISQVGVLAFTLMVPVLSGYIAYAIADRPGLAPGMIGGFIANTGALYGSESGAGFIGAIVTGFLAGYVALAIKKIPVHRYIAPIWPIIVIPVLTTLVVALLFVYVLGAPIAGAFAALTAFLAGLEGGSVILLGAVLGAMIAFDMGGPVNKTAFLFGGGLIAAGNAAPMGMVAAAIAVPPLGMGLATLLRRRYFTAQERESGIAALFMGFFGITEGAIPFAAARPLQVIPANMLGGTVAGAVAAVLAVEDNVMHGGPIVAVLGAVENVAGFFVAIGIGLLVTALTALFLLGLSARRNGTDGAAPDGDTEGRGGSAGAESDRTGTGEREPVAVGAAGGSTAAASASAPSPGLSGAAPAARAGQRRTGSVLDHLSEDTVLLDVDGAGRDDVVRRLVELGAATGQVRDVDAVVAAALAREGQGTTGVGQGIAIPHAKSAEVAAPLIAFARSDEGVEWEAMDGAPVHLVFLIAVPQEQAGDEHLKILATLSRALTKTEFRNSLLEARSRSEVIRVLEDRLG
ncbi:fructose-specific PTS transporter subunit EIIC [uncultured Kocuria sp.]|uniref:fructose-specific PTS transporter subunit EIIC n=1 Tax=uncultured Kocuria sp. TaxID=259305 RepID=UPI0026348E54|nr:fructose-specific PTS transporter subunit EIIC [uncultured Kocuria sp.]